MSESRRPSWRQCLTPGLLLVICVLSAGVQGATTFNLWTNSADGLWSVASNWSSNHPPDSTTSGILITNANTKIVTVDAATPAANLSIGKLAVSAPGGSTNTLQLIDLALNQPLQLSDTLTVDRGGAVRITNSTLTINGSLGGIFSVPAGSVTLDSGLIDCSTTTAGKIGSAAGGAGSVNLNGGTMQVFQLQLGALSGSEGRMNLANGALSCASLFTLGQSVNSTGIVALTGGQLIVTNDETRVGNLGVGRLSLSGGEADFAFLSLGDNFGSSGKVSVSGGLLKVTPRLATHYLRVGYLGDGELDISGGTNLVSAEFHLADDIGATGIVSITGGRVIATNQITAIGRYGYGLMTISNASVQLTNTSVGRHGGANGFLVVQADGALTQLDDLSIGRFTDLLGPAVGHVLVDGGLLGLTNDNIWAGREGTGELTVSNGTVVARALFVGMSPDGTNAPSGVVTLGGGITSLSSNLVVGSALLSTGQVNVLGGSLVVNGNNGSGYLSVVNGGFALSGGSVLAAHLLLTNAGGELTFNSGSLQAQSMTIANGLPFIVGDGIRPAVLQLLNGTCTFADGLVISSNATVTGCGAIVGNITNFGTLATNCGPVITAIAKSGDTATVFFSTLSGSNHVLVYKNGLGDAVWTAIPPGIVGDGTVMSRADTNATVVRRFYRIRAQ